MKEECIKKHVFVFNPKDNGGEQLILTTEFFDNGDCAAYGFSGGVYTNQQLSLQSYGNSASMNLYGIVLSPENLRQLANELESMKLEAIHSIRNK